MKQTSLFGNLPQLNKKTRELNKKVVEKANQPKATSKTVSVRGAKSGASSIIKRVESVVQVAKQKLIVDDSLLLLRDEQDFKEYMRIVRANGHAALDTETTGLDPIENKLVGVCLYTPNEKAVYIPTGHTDYTDNLIPNQIDPELVRQELQKCINQDVGFILHNAKFDMRVLKNQLEMDKYIKCIWDTQIAGNMLNEIEPHGLKYLWNKYVNRNAEDEAETFDTLFEKIPFNYIPMEIGYIYAAKDPKMTYELYQFQKQFLDPESPKCVEKELDDVARLLNEIEIPLIEHICQMEDTGVSIDDKKASELSEKYHEMLEVAEQRFQEEVRKIDLSRLTVEQMSKLSDPINVGSPTQLAIIIYDALKMTSTDKRKPRGTGEEILMNLKQKHPKYGPFFDSIVEYKGIKKLLSTYIDKLPALVKETTGKLHGQFNQYGAKTGRFSSSDPNLQNIPSRNKEIRKMFIASPGYVLIGADYSQQEPRVLAHLCYELFGDDRLMNVYKEGKDLYAWMASEIYKVSYEDCKEFKQDGTKNPEGKKRRDSVKSIILGQQLGRLIA